jgi:hypothetical protein
VSPLNGDPWSESIASEPGLGWQPIEGQRNVNIESLYEVNLSTAGSGGVAEFP